GGTCQTLEEGLAVELAALVRIEPDALEPSGNVAQIDAGRGQEGEERSVVDRHEHVADIEDDVLDHGALRVHAAATPASGAVRRSQRHRPAARATRHAARR